MNPTATSDHRLARADLRAFLRSARMRLSLITRENQALAGPANISRSNFTSGEKTCFPSLEKALTKLTKSTVGLATVRAGEREHCEEVKIVVSRRFREF